jgi:hypothetical protein
MKHVKTFENFLNETDSWSAYSNNELAAQVIELSNEKKAAESRGKKKEAELLSKDLEEVKAELTKRKKPIPNVY